MQHNLACSLLSGEVVTPVELYEGLRLCEEAVRVRTRERDTRHNWETTILAGGALARVLRQPGFSFDNLPWRPHEIWHEARRWLRLAVEAVRLLGPGKEMMDSAFNLVGLCPTAGNLVLAAEVAEEAWSVLGEASPYLILNAAAQEEEAIKAHAVSRELTYRLASEGLSVATDDLMFVMEGERAETVLRWVARSQAPLRRPLRARIHRPPQVPIPVWMAWQDALESGDPAAMVKPLDRVRELAPGFLSETPDLESTWSWLAAHPGAVGIAAVLAEPVTTVLVLQYGGAGRRRVRALGLKTQDLPPDLGTLTLHLSQATTDIDSAVQHHDQAAAWVRDTLIVPVLKYLGEPPSLVLWCPGPGLRLLSPQAIWGDIPVVGTLSLDLPVLQSAPARPRSTLVVLADPRAEGLEPLGEHGMGALSELTAAATLRGPVRRLASVGSRHGRELLGDSTDVCVGPASARRLLAEAREHDVVVVIAHGDVPRPEQASLLCADEDGDVDRLGVGDISRFPDRITGALVLLLSCDSGRVGDQLAEPGGVAGALIAAGARAVVAPLWPVPLDVAAEVIMEVLEALASWKEPWEALAEEGPLSPGDGPVLGPAPSLSRQKAAETFQRMAFVTWVG